MKVRPWLMVMPGGATLISLGIAHLLAHLRFYSAGLLAGSWQLLRAPGSTVRAILMDGQVPTSQSGHGLILARTRAWLARIPLRSGYISAPRMADGRVNERPAKGGQDETMT